MSSISTHVLDIAQGRPAVGLPVTLEIRDGAGWRKLAAAVTDADGRVRPLLPTSTALEAQTYRITFDTSSRSRFYPEVQIVFTVAVREEHYHVPLLLSPHGYSTYRGS